MATNYIYLVYMPVAMCKMMTMYSYGILHSEDKSLFYLALGVSTCLKTAFQYVIVL